MYKTTGDGLGPIETSDNVAVMNAQNNRWGLGPIETCNSGAKVAKNHTWGLAPIEACISGPKDAVLHAKATNEGWVE